VISISKEMAAQCSNVNKTPLQQKTIHGIPRLLITIKQNVPCIQHH